MLLFKNLFNSDFPNFWGMSFLIASYWQSLHSFKSCLNFHLKGQLWPAGNVGNEWAQNSFYVFKWLENNPYQKNTSWPIKIFAIQILVSSIKFYWHTATRACLGKRHGWGVGPETCTIWPFIEYVWETWTWTIFYGLLLLSWSSHPKQHSNSNPTNKVSRGKERTQTSEWMSLPDENHLFSLNRLFLTCHWPLIQCPAPPASLGRAEDTAIFT